MDILVRPELAKHMRAVRELNRAVFRGEDEARLVDALRDGGFARFSLVAKLDCQIVGHLMLSAIQIEAPGESTEALALAPMAVAPGFQRRGVGTQLVDEAIRRARLNGHRVMIVLGHPEYYPRFGFKAALARSLESPYSGDAFMAIELVRGALDGVRGRVVYSPPFAELGVT